MASQSWFSPFGSQFELTQIIGVQFQRAGSSLESASRLDDRQNDIVRFLERNRAIKVERPPASAPARAAAPPQGRVWIDQVDPYALQVCKHDLAVELPRRLSAARPAIEAATNHVWTMNPASMTARLADVKDRDRFRQALIAMREAKLVEMERGGADTIVIIDASRKLAAGMAAGVQTTKFTRPSTEGKVYDLGGIGPLTIFPGGRMTPAWRGWAPGS